MFIYLTSVSKMLPIILNTIFVIVAIIIIALILVQKGKGADMGASFGSGASATLFGSSGTGNFLTRSTSIFMVIFVVICIALARWHPSNTGKYTNFEATESNVQQTAPAADIVPDHSAPAQESTNTLDTIQ